MDEAVSRAARDPFHVGASFRNSDLTSHVFGLVAAAVQYRRVTADASYLRFAGEQTAWVCGANPWGTSMVVGAGTVYPRCPHHRIANLSGKPLIGAAVNGADPFLAMTGNRTRYQDDATAWQSAEPTIDTTSTGLLALTLLARG